MARLRVRRMPVLDHSHRPGGFVSLVDVALKAPAKVAGDGLLDITELGGEHSQVGNAEPLANRTGRLAMRTVCSSSHLNRLTSPTASLADRQTANHNAAIHSFFDSPTNLSLIPLSFFGSE